MAPRTKKVLQWVPKKMQKGSIGWQQTADRFPKAETAKGKQLTGPTVDRGQDSTTLDATLCEWTEVVAYKDQLPRRPERGDREDDPLCDEPGIWTSACIPGPSPVAIPKLILPPEPSSPMMTNCPLILGDQSQGPLADHSREFLGDQPDGAASPDVGAAGHEPPTGTSGPPSNYEPLAPPQPADPRARPLDLVEMTQEHGELTIQLAKPTGISTAEQDGNLATPCLTSSMMGSTDGPELRPEEAGQQLTLKMGQPTNRQLRAPSGFQAADLGQAP